MSKLLIMGNFNIEDHNTFIVLGYLVVFGILDATTGLYHRSKRTKDDWLIETTSIAVIAILIKPGAAFITVLLGKAILPNYFLYFQEVNLLISLSIFLLVDDLSQYWYHRSAHEYPFLWKLHRPHHVAPEMGIFVTYREAFLYPVLIPSVWWMGICLFLGWAPAVAFGVIIKQLVLVSSHSNWKWDAPLYRHHLTRPLILAIRRIIITPAFHHAHHGLTAKDGVSNPHGNFGNLFSIWDQMFGTAMFTSEFPKAYGVENDLKEGFLSHYFYPWFRTRNPQSELHKDFQKQSYAEVEPFNTTLEAGQYLYCTCGLSNIQPFCNSSHNGTKHKPLFFTLSKTKKVSLCKCKLTKNPPYCDGSHKHSNTGNAVGAAKPAQH